MSLIREFLADDHGRLDALLQEARKAEPSARERPYEEFRKGLLKHVGMEEMILLPAVKRLRGKPASLAARLRAEHGALTALLVPSPTPRILAALAAILEPHNRLEERADGIYEECEKSLGKEAPAVLEKLHRARDIPPAAHSDSPHAMAALRRALAAAGFGGLLDA